MIKFGTGGWRAVIADGFTKANIQLLSSALADMILEKCAARAEVCIGYDRRFLSRESAFWAAEALTAKGVVCNIIDRESPTPIIMYAVMTLGLPFGLAVTASHNPAVYNGVKVFTQGGRDASEEVTDEIERYIEKIEGGGKGVPLMDEAESRREGLLNIINPQNDYIDDILKLVETKVIKDAGLKIALDPMYGVSQTSLRTILMTARCDVLVIHERHDTLFGGRLPAPNVKTLSALSDFTVESKCDFGIATDGDADRLGVIDDHGKFIHPNQLLTLLYYYLLEYKGWRGPAVRNISTTHLLDKVAKAYGQVCHEVPVGFKHISSKMNETDAIIGGESSGGLTVKGHIYGKDGIYAATLLTEMTAKTHKSISMLYQEIADRFGEVYICDQELTFRPSEKSGLIEYLFTEQNLPVFEGGEFQIEKVSYLDGCKIYFKNNGWVTIRFSGTEPLLRVNSEMPTQKLADEAAGQVLKFIAAARGDV
jgi:phosphomannomutase